MVKNLQKCPISVLKVEFNNFLLSFFASNKKYSSSIIAFVNQFNAKTSIFRFEKQKLASLA